jgi:hypothetical protein
VLDASVDRRCEVRLLLVADPAVATLNTSLQRGIL